MKPTNISKPDYFHKVVDCQHACPAHTPVPEYIRLIAAQRYTDAYMVNWESNVFPGVLGRTCDRPCEPACRRGRVEDEPVAICRLKRVAADNKDDITSLLPAAGPKNGKKLALIGAGPASLTVARDLSPLGYEIHVYDENAKGGGFMRSQIPSFRLPDEVLDEEVGYITDNKAVTTFYNTRVDSLRAMLDKDYDAVFVGSGAPKGRDLPNLPGRKEGADNIHIGIDWLASVAFEHRSSVGKKVIVLGGGNTAMDCCRTARRIGGAEVKVIVRSPFADMKASPWEKDDAVAEDIPIVDNHTPLEFVIEEGKLVGMRFDKVRAEYDQKNRRKLVSTGEEPAFYPCDEVLVAIGQENSFPWIESETDIEFDNWGLPTLNKETFQSTNSQVFFGGDSAFGPENIITAVAQAHQAAISIDLFCQGEDLGVRPAPTTNLVSQKMGIHEWSYSNAVDNEQRFKVPHADKAAALGDRLLEVELGFSTATGFEEAQRCLNCDVQTVFSEALCIECDACTDICPTDCINFIDNAKEAELRPQLRMPAQNLEQDLYVSSDLPTGRVMVKDEDVCLHCGLCAERCPTSAWDMQQFLYQVTKASQL
ncbi:MAG: FAD-dependent oxidoreductase [Gammaproteobacteria bacterium]|nr:FAD-dependent oxidoreductase [Gammaproteobacteria bacterium]MBQ0838573.1 FAD-dependent oxidoreductase [Gammaproteobacteria bacterium]